MADERNALPGHAIDTAQVAAVGHGYAKIVDVAIKAVSKLIHCLLSRSVRIIDLAEVPLFLSGFLPPAALLFDWCMQGHQICRRSGIRHMKNNQQEKKPFHTVPSWPARDMR